MPGLTDNLKDIDDARKTAVINDELRRLNVDIAALQETRLADSGTLKEQDYTFYWQGRGPMSPGSTDKGCRFYEDLTATIRNVPSDEQLVLLGDFNERVSDDHDSWPAYLGKFGVGKMNENGQRALEFCTYHNPCITKSYFQTKPQHKVSWRHPRSKLWHGLDLILTRRTSLLTRAYQSADCDTDHSLICCKFKMEPKIFHHAIQPGKPRIDISSMSQPELLERFTVAFEKEVNSKPSGLSATKKWNICET
ncbi:craniofacial development protein 2-like [Branchiostoma lanceolatum]|uniref:craniofacial development protein 2-like n=1 Tax=Branchiostoma lanceolatum TaxID=7740 RepID=UPI003453BD91